MEQRLRETDFSRFSKVWEGLKEKLLSSYDRGVRLLEDDELDMLAAAGNGPQYRRDQLERHN